VTPVAAHVESVPEMVKVFDDFCPEPEWNYEQALKAPYVEIAMGGTMFRGISVCDARWAYDIFSNLLEIKADRVFEYYRKYEKGMKQGTFIHSDKGISEWTAVLSLRDSNGGLAFWKHRDTGTVAAAEWFDWQMVTARDGFDEPAWEIVGLIPMVRNRCVVYPAAMFHSRYPQNWNKDEARMVQVFFFNRGL
jgi:hypothetical protein